MTADPCCHSATSRSPMRTVSKKEPAQSHDQTSRNLSQMGTYLRQGPSATWHVLSPSKKWCVMRQLISNGSSVLHWPPCRRRSGTWSDCRSSMDISSGLFKHIIWYIRVTLVLQHTDSFWSFSESSVFLPVWPSSGRSCSALQDFFMSNLRSKLCSSALWKTMPALLGSIHFSKSFCCKADWSFRLSQ